MVVDQSIIPDNESERMDALQRYQILDTPEDGAFNLITELASTILHVPIAIVSLVDNDRIWFKSHHGLDVSEIDREPGLCASAILGTGPYIISDARVDPRSLTNPLVAGEFGLRFYAASPLRTQDGYNLGTLCCLDFKPRQFTAEQTKILESLATLVMDQMELRLSARHVDELHHNLSVSNEALAKQKYLLEQELFMAREVYSKVTAYNDSNLPGLEYVIAPLETVGGDFFLEHITLDKQKLYLMIGDLTGHGLQAALSVMLIAEVFDELCVNHPHVEQIAHDVNLKMCSKLPRGLFCASIIIKLNLPAKTFEIWHGGLPEAYLLDAQGQIINTLVSNNFALGVLSDWDFTGSSSQHTFNEANSLIIYSDGVNEQSGKDGNEFGIPRLQQALQEAPIGSSRVQFVLSRLRMHQQDCPQSDDISLFELNFSKILTGMANVNLQQ